MDWQNSIFLLGYKANQWRDVKFYTITAILQKIRPLVNDESLYIMEVIGMELRDMEKLAFLILKELDLKKSDVELIKDIRKNGKAYHSALKEIPVDVPKAQIINSPF